jgi:type II secretory pathway component PulF
MRFKYRAKKGLEGVVEGTIEARDKDDALNAIIERGLFPVKIEEAPLPASRYKAKRKRIKKKDVLFFIQKLATLCKAKVDLLTSLRILHSQVESRRLQDTILEVYNATKEGKTFSESLGKFPHIFSSLIVNIVKSGEASGHLDVALQHINEFLSREENLRSKVLVALAYPAFLLFVGMISIIVLMTFIIPRLGGMFEELGKDLPLVTKITLRVSEGFQIWGIWVLGLFILFLVFFAYRRDSFNKVRRYLRLHTPVVKKLAKHQELISFSHSLSLLLRSGVPTLNSLEIASTTVDDPKTREELKKVYSDVALGQSLSKSMENVSSLPELFVKMISLGEESGRLGEVLEELARSSTQEIEKDIGFITSLLEPLLILILGIILGTIVFSILLPIFQITQMVR